MTTTQHIICNGASSRQGRTNQRLILDYRDTKSQKANLRIDLAAFIRQLDTLPPRILDLLEIACYVHAADRKIDRGPTRAVEFQHWSRKLHFHIKVRDVEFWNDPKVRKHLASALEFMTGDSEYAFEFESGHFTAPASLFDQEGSSLTATGPISVVLFSGGIDSLTGLLHLLHTTNQPLCVVSHLSCNPSSKMTQDRLLEALTTKYPSRIKRCTFRSSLVGDRATDETQRSRAFLYGSIAFAAASAYRENTIHICDNGVTSVNLARREDLMNARASRTTHPKTLHELQQVFSLVAGAPFQVHNPFQWFTKTDVLNYLRELEGESLLASTVSCGRSVREDATLPHCGGCFQCVDRRLCSFGASMEECDAQYELDFIRACIPIGEARTTLVDYLRQAVAVAANHTLESFYATYISELPDLAGYFGEMDEQTAISKLWTLYQRHGEQIVAALRRIQAAYDDPRKPRQEGTILSIIADKEYLKVPAERLADRITSRLRRGIPLLFRSTRPKHEAEFNDGVEGLLKDGEINYEREAPTVRFAMANTKPDHSIDNADLILESKYLRGSVTPAKITDELAADVVKYPKQSLILFVLYDPDHKISDDDSLAREFNDPKRCKFAVIR